MQNWWGYLVLWCVFAWQHMVHPTRHVAAMGDHCNSFYPAVAQKLFFGNRVWKVGNSIKQLMDRWPPIRNPHLIFLSVQLREVNTRKFHRKICSCLSLVAIMQPLWMFLDVIKRNKFEISTFNVSGINAELEYVHCGLTCSLKRGHYHQVYP